MRTENSFRSEKKNDGKLWPLPAKLLAQHLWIEWIFGDEARFFFVRDEARLLLAWGKQGERNLDGENVCLALFYLPTTSQVIVVVSILAVKKAGHEVAGTCGHFHEHVTYHASPRVLAYLLLYRVA